MATQRMKRREDRRAKLCASRAKTRDEIMVKFKDRANPVSFEERQALYLRLRKMPKDAAKVRQRIRCSVTGRPRGIWRKYGVCRHVIRELFNRGEIPGMQKASW